MSKYQCNLEAIGDFEKFDIRTSSNGAKLFYYDGKRIAKNKVPLCLQDTLIKKITRKTVSNPSQITSYLSLFASSSETRTEVYIDDDSVQSLLKYHNWKWLLTISLFLMQKVYINC